MGRKPRESSPVTKKFAENLEDLIEEKKKSGLKHEEISTLAGVGSGALSEWASDTKTANIDSLVKLAKYFNVSCDYLLGLSKIKSVVGNEQSATSLGLPNHFVEYVMSLDHKHLDHQVLCSILSNSNLRMAVQEIASALHRIDSLFEKGGAFDESRPCITYEEEQSIFRDVSERTSGGYSVVPTEVLIDLKERHANDYLSASVRNCIIDYCIKNGFDYTLLDPML